MQNFKAIKILILLSFWIAFPTVSWAQLTCGSFSNTNQQGDTHSPRPYRINATSFPLAGMTAEEMRYSAIFALDTLTSQSDAAAFQYKGTTTFTNFPFTLAGCGILNIDYNLVASKPLTGGVGTYNSRCRDPNNSNRGTKFQIFSNSNVNWAIGDASNGWDIIQNWMHEGLHSYKLTHPPASVFSIVQTMQLPFSNNLGRDLYEWDLKCIEEKTQSRSGTHTYRLHQNGSFGGSQALTLLGSNGSIGLTKNSNSSPGSFYPNTVYRFVGYVATGEYFFFRRCGDSRLYSSKYAWMVI